MPTTYDDKQFAKDFTELNKSLLQKLALAQTTEDAQGALDMLEGLATQENSPASAKTIYGLAYLIEDKPWYDFKRGFEAIKDAAESDEPFCWFILGSLYLNGKPELPKDPVSAKYWIDKAADAGYKDAQVIQELKWGDNPEGFVGWLAERLEKENRWRRWIGIGLIGLVVIAVIVILLV